MLMRPRLWIAVLVCLLGVLQYRLWIADGGIPSVHHLQAKVQNEKKTDLHLQARNDAMEAEVENLKSGTAAIAGRARSELGMVKRGETFFLLVHGKAGGAASTAQSAAQ